LKKRAFAFGQFNSFLMDQVSIECQCFCMAPSTGRARPEPAHLRGGEAQDGAAEAQAQGAAGPSAFRHVSIYDLVHLQAAERAERVRQRSSQRSSLVDPVLDHPNDDDEDLEQGQNQQQPEMNHQEFGADNGEEEEDYDDDLMPNMGLDDMDEEDNTTVGGDANNLAELLEVDELQNSLGGIQNMYTGFQAGSVSMREANFGDLAPDQQQAEGQERARLEAGPGQPPAQRVRRDRPVLGGAGRRRVLQPG
jgi:hypothetical protein